METRKFSAVDFPSKFPFLKESIEKRERVSRWVYHQNEIEKEIFWN